MDRAGLIITVLIARNHNLNQELIFTTPTILTDIYLIDKKSVKQAVIHCQPGASTPEIANLFLR